MKNYLLKADKKLLRIIRTIGKLADRKKLPVYVVGGIVRDMVLGRTNLDLDICVQGDVIGLAKGLARLWKVPLTVYKEFQTACLQLPGGVRVDVARTRRESYAHPGALPVVRPGTLKEDLFRRDFTVNAMAIAINAGSFGELIDEFGGMADIRKKKIRILHDQSFMDDPTRVLRAVRFEQRFHFQMQRNTLKLINSALNKKAELSVKPPRYFAEFKKILCEPDPVGSIKRLYSIGGLRFLDPKLKIQMRQLSHLQSRLGQMSRSAIYRNLKVRWLLYFLGLIDQANDRIAQEILKKFHFKKEERLCIVQIRNKESIMKRLSADHMRASQIYRILKPLQKEVIIYLRAAAAKPLICRRIDRFLKEHSHIELKISGADLRKLGIEEGRTIGKVLDAVLCLKIDKQVSTKRQELDKAMASLEKC